MSTASQQEALSRTTAYSNSDPEWKKRQVEGLWTTADGRLATGQGDINDLDLSNGPDRYYGISSLLSLSGTGGGLATRRPPHPGSRFADSRSAADVNKYLNDTGYSLMPGEGKAVVGYQTVTSKDPRTPAKRLPIYGNVAAKAPATPPPTAPASPAPEAPRPGTTEQDREAQDLYARAEDNIYGRNDAGRRPQLETNVPLGQGTDAVARYGSQLADTNRIFSSAMNDRAKASGYQMGRMFQYAASNLPAAPKTDGTDDLISAIKKVNELKLFA